MPKRRKQKRHSAETKMRAVQEYLAGNLTILERNSIISIMYRFIPFSLWSKFPQEKFLNKIPRKFELFKKKKPDFFQNQDFWWR